jgi:hypothetical protein
LRASGFPVRRPEGGTRPTIADAPDAGFRTLFMLDRLGIRQYRTAPGAPKSALRGKFVTHP